VTEKPVSVGGPLTEFLRVIVNHNMQGCGQKGFAMSDRKTS